jgi:S-adenosylmethionine hydrolase
MDTHHTRRILSFAVAVSLAAAPLSAQQAALVLQSDFGLLDGSVASMKGVAVGVSPSLRIFDLTHQIPPFDIWTAAYRLRQSVPYWPKGTVFVSIVDPGVGTDRKSVVARTKLGHFVVTPDNGTLTFLAEQEGIAEVREIDERINRRPGTERSHTFHGRDVYVYTGARLAANAITFAQVGPRRDVSQVVLLPYRRASLVDGVASGAIMIHDVPYGNLWTNVDAATFDRLGGAIGERFDVRVLRGDSLAWQGTVPFVKSFGSVAPGEPLLYLNSLLDVSLALNAGNFAQKFGIGSRGEWRMEIRRMR